MSRDEGADKALAEGVAEGAAEGEDARKRKKDGPPSPPVSPPVQPIARAVTPAIGPRSRFQAMYQGPGTNVFSHLSTRSHPPEVDEVTGVARITEGPMTALIEQFNRLTGGLRVSTHKLLDACTIALTAQNHYRSDGPMETLVSIPLDDYMAQCGIPMTKASKDRTRRRVREDLEVLYNTSLSWQESGGAAGVRDYAQTRIITLQAIRGGRIVVRFSEEMARYLTHAYVMQFSLALFRLDERNPSAYYLGRKLLLHASIHSNQRRGTDSLLSVRTLLACAPDIPTYEEVMQGDRHLERKIIVPFENALAALSDILTWEYTNARGAPLTQAQLARFDYAVFIECYVRFEGVRRPDALEDGAGDAGTDTIGGN